MQVTMHIGLKSIISISAQAIINQSDAIESENELLYEYSHESINCSPNCIPVSFFFGWRVGLRACT